MTAPVKDCPIPENDDARVRAYTPAQQAMRDAEAKGDEE